MKERERLTITQTSKQKKRQAGNKKTGKRAYTAQKGDESARQRKKLTKRLRDGSASDDDQCKERALSHLRTIVWRLTDKNMMFKRRVRGRQER